MIVFVLRPLTIGLLFVLTVPAHAAEIWTLPLTVKRALDAAPEARVADAEIRARAGELARDRAWPNPTIEVRADRRLGLETGNGGADVTQLALTQPLPISRLSHQRERAQANLAAAQANRTYQRLQLENQAARAFHALQAADAKYRLAEQRFETARQYSATGAGNRARDRLVRYLTPLDRTRLTLLRESTRQALATAEGERREAALRFRQLLALPQDAHVETAPLAPAIPVATPDSENRLDAHPAVIAGQNELEAARRGVAVARASRFADPTISVFRERDVFASGEQSYYGVAVGVQIPLWNVNQGEVARAGAEANRVEAALAVRRRDLESALRETRLRLDRFAQQATVYATDVLEPSRRFLELTRRAFAAGEVGVLVLLDANNGYFDAAQRHLELLAEAAAAAADLRLAAGRSLLAENGS